MVRRNGVKNGLVYLQVTRGVAGRDFLFPADTKPSLVVTAKKVDPAIAAGRAESGIKVITVPENRWDRVDIKTVGLLPNVLAKEKARAAGAQEAWFVDTDGTVKEGGSSNAWIVTKDGFAGHPAGRAWHPARHHAHDAVRSGGQARAQRSRSAASRWPKRRRRAKPSSARQRRIAMPVVAIDGDPVANGHPGSIVLSLREAFFDVAEKRLA